MQEADSRKKKTVTSDTLKSMSFSRGASALGVAVALDEVDVGQISDEKICSDWSLFSTVASTSAGVELMNCEIILMANSAHSSSKFIVAHSLMMDCIDGAAVVAVLQNANITLNELRTLSNEDKTRIVNVFAKAEASNSGSIRGARHTMLTDSDVSSTRHARATVGAVIASIVGHTVLYVSGGAEHQGPQGGGPVAVIAYV